MNQKVVKYKSVSPQVYDRKAFIRFFQASTKRFWQENKQNTACPAATEPFEAADKLAQAIGRAFPVH
jgi:hypothetical protein